MKSKPMFSIASAPLAATLFLLGAAPASAGPMRCGDQHIACLAYCHKLTDPAYIPNCVTNCHTALSSCTRTGCWNDGVKAHCGYLRK